MTDTPSHLPAIHHGPRRLTIPKAHSPRFSGSVPKILSAMLPHGGWEAIREAGLLVLETVDAVYSNIDWRANNPFLSLNNQLILLLQHGEFLISFRLAAKARVSLCNI
jgi:hypothetical protein